MTKREKATALFLEGYNCAQAVFLAFAEDYGMDRDMALKLASAFGAGMGNMKEICGAVSGMLMTLGLYEGYTSPTSPEEKALTYKKAHNLADEFKEKYGSLLCRELLASLNKKEIPEEIKSRPCAIFVGEAAEILENHLSK